jgi:hypothetical protein
MAAVAKSPVMMAAAGDELPMEVVTAALSRRHLRWRGWMHAMG